ncbi:MAG: hypothetical protein WA975_15710 [Mesorhizobium sp.]
MTLTPSSRRLLILACSATKRDGETYMPAIDRYDGPLWRTLRAADPERRLARVAFLSARLGFRCADTPIKLYDARMTAEIAERMKAGGLATRWPRPRTQRNVMPEGDHPGMHIASLSGHGRQPFADVALVGGQLYLDVMRHFAGLFRERGHIAADAAIIEINGPIGCMRRDLRRWLLAGQTGAGGRP